MFSMVKLKETGEEKKCDEKEDIIVSVGHKLSFMKLIKVEKLIIRSSYLTIGNKHY